LLVCSDGLSDVVGDEVLGEALGSAAEPDACAEALVKVALQGGAPDNVTVVIADVVEADDGAGSTH
jgi:protein phosphatase